MFFPCLLQHIANAIACKLQLPRCYLLLSLACCYLFFLLKVAMYKFLVSTEYLLLQHAFCCHMLAAISCCLQPLAYYYILSFITIWLHWLLVCCQCLFRAATFLLLLLANYYLLHGIRLVRCYCLLANAAYLLWPLYYLHRLIDGTSYLLVPLVSPTTCLLMLHAC